MTGDGISLLFIAEEFVVLAEDVEEANVVEENVKVQIIANEPVNKIKARHIDRKVVMRWSFVLMEDRIFLNVIDGGDNMGYYKDILL